MLRVRGQGSGHWSTCFTTAGIKNKQPQWIWSKCKNSKIIIDKHVAPELQYTCSDEECWAVIIIQMFPSFLFISRLVTLDARAAADRCQSLRGARERAEPHHFSVFCAGTLKIWGKYYITKIIVLFLGLSYFSRCIIYCRARYDDWSTPPVWDGLRPRCRLRGIASFYLMPTESDACFTVSHDETVASDVTLSLPNRCRVPVMKGDGGRVFRISRCETWQSEERETHGISTTAAFVLLFLTRFAPHQNRR